jgi:hypothetical protein
MLSKNNKIGLNKLIAILIKKQLFIINIMMHIKKIYSKSYN